MSVFTPHIYDMPITAIEPLASGHRSLLKPRDQASFLYAGILDDLNSSKPSFL